MVWAQLNEEQGKAISEIVRSGSDRIIAVVGGAILDDSLRRTLEQRLRPKSGKSDINDRLFRVNGPLGDLRPKIDLGYQFYVFDKPIRNAMWGINKIRNLFAHNLDMSFDHDSKPLADEFNRLGLHEGRKYYPTPFWDSRDSEEEIEKIEGRRDQFIVNLKICLLWLMADIHKHRAYCNIPTNMILAGPNEESTPAP